MDWSVYRWYKPYILYGMKALFKRNISLRRRRFALISAEILKWPDRSSYIVASKLFKYYFYFQVWYGSSSSTPKVIWTFKTLWSMFLVQNLALHMSSWTIGKYMSTYVHTVPEYSREIVMFCLNVLAQHFVTICILAVDQCFLKALHFF